MFFPWNTLCFSIWQKCFLCIFHLVQILLKWCQDQEYFNEVTNFRIPSRALTRATGLSTCQEGTHESAANSGSAVVLTHIQWPKFSPLILYHQENAIPVKEAHIIRKAAGTSQSPLEISQDPLETHTIENHSSK